MAITFVTAIDTDAGKSYATGLLANHLTSMGASTITAKIVQTGAEGFSADLALHRRLMGMEPTDEDRAGLTCPCLFPFPGSPHLAAKLAGRVIDPERIIGAMAELARRYDEVVVEGVGGWLVPLTEEITVADLAARADWPTVVVTSPRLGSLNHTLLTLEAVKGRGVTLLGGVYNRFAQAEPAIAEDSFHLLSRAFAPAPLVDIPRVDDPENPPVIDFSPLFKGMR